VRPPSWGRTFFLWHHHESLRVVSEASSVSRQFLFTAFDVALRRLKVTKELIETIVVRDDVALDEVASAESYVLLDNLEAHF